MLERVGTILDGHNDGSDGSEADANGSPDVHPVGIAWILFAVLFALTVILLRRPGPSDPHDAGTWLTQASTRRELRFELALIPFCGIFSPCSLERSS
jgi:hypothetical protein